MSSTSLYFADPATHTGRYWYTPKTQKSDEVYAVQRSRECSDLYIWKNQTTTEEALRRRADSSGPDSAVFLKKKAHSFEHSTVQEEY